MLKQAVIRLAVIASGLVVLLAVALIFCAAALYMYLSTQIGPVAAALCIAGIAFAFVAALGFAAISAIRRVQVGMKSMLPLRMLGLLGPVALQGAARGFAGKTPLGSLAAMGVSYMLARRKRRQDGPQA